MVSLDADDAVAGKRERAEKEAAEKAAWALANPEEAAAEAAEAGAEATDEKPDEEKLQTATRRKLPRMRTRTKRKQTNPTSTRLRLTRRGAPRDGG